jgi:hypothetical protein
MSKPLTNDQPTFENYWMLHRIEFESNYQKFECLFFQYNSQFLRQIFVQWRLIQSYLIPMISGWISAPDFSSDLNRIASIITKSPITRITFFWTKISIYKGLDNFNERRSCESRAWFLPYVWWLWSPKDRLLFTLYASWTMYPNWLPKVEPFVRSRLLTKLQDCVTSVKGSESFEVKRMAPPPLGTVVYLSNCERRFWFSWGVRPSPRPWCSVLPLLS